MFYKQLYSNKTTSQIFLFLPCRDQGPLYGPVLIYRNPGLHPGDIHVVNARYIKGLEEFVGNSKYGIFFPSKGPRSMADEIAGGDYDGDMYWVSTNTEVCSCFLFISCSYSWKMQRKTFIFGHLVNKLLKHF